MNKAKYIKYFLIAVAAYILFIIRGLANNHYLDWSLDFQISDCIEIMIFTLPIVYFPLRWFSKKSDYFKDSLWFAFFLSVPFIFFDIIYVGIIRGHGLGYFKPFWFLSIFYFIVLIEAPIIGYLMQKEDPNITKKHLMMLFVAIVLWLLNLWEGSQSNHYIDWSLNMKIVRLINILLILLPITYLLLRFYSDIQNYLKDACILALYLASIFILFDFLYLGISKHYWLRYLREYWFVTLFYPVIWIEVPLIGWIMQKNKLKRERGKSL